MKLTAGTPEQQRRQLITLGVVIAIGVLVYFKYPWAPVPAGPPPVTTVVPGAASNTPAGAPRGAASSQVLPEPIKLSRLQVVNEETQGNRDPFGFGVPPKPPAPPPPPPAPVVIRPTPPPEPPKPTGPPPRPQIPVKFLGFAEDLSRPGKLVSLSVNGSVVLAREGDVVDGKYRLVKVGLESIVMAYLDGQGQQIIRSGG
ncbi:MAG TPA: hypothetical protein VMZ90_07535 [Vicinamibacterales bacterium]|nr:hypothetical protein [Vicinamibacterales bacterium]